jgi:hypothetical protein
MQVKTKLCSVAAIWAAGIYLGATSSSDPAGQGYALAIPIITALLLSIPFTLSLSRTPISGNTGRRKALRILRYVPLAIAVSPAVLIVAGPLLFLVLSCFKFVLPPVLAVAAIWFFVVYRRRKQARQICDSLQLPAEPEAPAPPATPPAPAIPAATPPTAPRVRWPACGISAWGLPLLAVPVGIFLGHLAGRCNYEGFQSWAILGWLFFPLVFAVPISAILATASLCRRERCPGLAVVLLVLYAIALAFWIFEDWAPLVLSAAGVVLLAAWLARLYRRKRGRF